MRVGHEDGRSNASNHLLKDFQRLKNRRPWAASLGTILARHRLTPAIEQSVSGHDPQTKTG